MADLKLELSLTPTASRFVSRAIEPGGPREQALLGTRGDGKTWACLIAMIAHAQEHKARGGALPTIWMGVADTFQSHKGKTHRSLLNPTWMGCWQLRDDGHTALFAPNRSAALVSIDLFGIEDTTAINRVRAECHGIWFEEPAPAGGDVSSSGINDDAWATALTSMRLPSYRHPALMSLNYPDEDHWVWQRFVDEVARLPGAEYYRIPPGERATAEQRAEWAIAMQNQPDLRRRLLEGVPGHVQLGPSVAQGYNPFTHIASEPLKVARGELWLGHDSSPGAHHHATIIGQREGRRISIYASLVSEGTGWKQHLETLVVPWFERRAPWFLDDRGTKGSEYLIHRYDPAMDTDEGGDIDLNPLKRGRRALGGTWMPGGVSWASRAGPMLASFNAGDAGRPLLQICPSPDTATLRKALGGRWYYRKLPSGVISKDLPHKPNHPWEDAGDAFCYLIGGMAPSRELARRRPGRIKSDFDVFSYEREPRTRTRRDDVPMIGADL